MNRDSTRTQNFTYDQVNRIVTGETSSTYATSPAHCWGESYTTDQWGNMTAIGVASSAYNGCTQETLSVTALSTNQLLSGSSFSYDASGNMLTDSVNTCAWNAESEIKSAASVNYTYDGDGNRLEKSSGKIYWYGAGTEILDESDLSGNFTNEYVFFGGKRIAMRNVSSGTIYYYAEDFLGSSRTLVQAGQTSVCYDADFYPFGGERDIVTTCSQNYKFEGKERDTETNNDDFGARYYTSRLGRWLSSDWSVVPAPVPYADLNNPQTLNLYAMVRDNPETFADLDGHDVPAPYCSRVSAATCAAVMKKEAEHPVRSALLPPAALAAWVTGAMFGPLAAETALLRFAPLLTAAGSALQSARDKAAGAIENLKGLSQSAVTNSRIASALNALKDHATDADLKGVMREGAGSLKGNHWMELEDTVGSLNNLKGSLQGALTNPNLTDETRSTYTQAINHINKFVSQAQAAIDAARRQQADW